MGKINETLIEMNNELEIIFDNAVIGMVFCDVYGSIVKVNGYFARMLGYEIDELENLKLSKITSEKDIAKDFELTAQILDNEIASFNTTKSYIHKNGQLIHTELNVTGLKNNQGLIDRFFAIVKDVKPMVSDEQTLLKYSALFSQALDKIPYRMFVKSIDSKYIVCNKAYAEYRDMTPMEMVGLSDYDVYDKDHADNCRNIDLRVMNTREPEEVVEEYMDGDRKSWQLIMKAPVVYEDECIGVIGTLVDVSDKVFFDKSLYSKLNHHKSENDDANKMFQMVFETSPNLMCDFHHDGTIARANKAFTTELGWDYNEVIGKHYSKFVKHEYMSEVVSINSFIDKYVDGDSFFLKLELLSKSGDYVLYEFCVRKISNYVVASGTNLHKQKQSEQYLIDSRISAEKARESAEEARVLAEKANNLKSEFIANMSHEIRTPLNAVIGFSELLENKLDDQQFVEYTRAINLAGKSLLSLISDILDISKIEAGMMDVVLQSTDINKLIGDIKSIFAAETTKKGLTFIVNKDVNTPSRILIDGFRLKQVLLNIVGNAFKFTSKGYVSIESKVINLTNDGFIDIDIYVSDSGVGIPENECDNIFLSFRQHLEINGEQYGGTGLGLSISKRLVELMGGTLSVLSEVNEGSKFIISLKGIEVGPDAVELPEVNNIEINEHIYFKNAKILMVDDEELNRLLMFELLNDRCEMITCASSAEEAVELLMQDEYDLIIMDLIMPVIDGSKAAKLIRRSHKYKDIPIICFSANAHNVSKQEEIEEVFNDYIVKPIHLNDLLKLLSKYLDTK